MKKLMEKGDVLVTDHDVRRVFHEASSAHGEDREKAIADTRLRLREVIAVISPNADKKVVETTIDHLLTESEV